MKIIQIIDLDGQPAAIAAGGRAIITDRVPPNQLAHVQAKALYALQIQAGNRTGPYTDHDAEQYARDIADTHTTRPPRPRRRRRRHSHRPQDAPRPT